MPSTKRWSDVFLYLGRVLILLIILAVLLPRLVMICNNWMSTFLHNDQKPVGHPMRVDVPLRGDVYYSRKDGSVKFIL